MTEQEHRRFTAPVAGRYHVDGTGQDPHLATDCTDDCKFRPGAPFVAEPGWVGQITMATSNSGGPLAMPEATTATALDHE